MKTARKVLIGNSIQLEKLEQEKPMLVHNILKSMEEYKSQQPIAEGEKVYRKVSVKERLPKEDGDYMTNLGWNRYRINKPTDRIEYQLWVHEIDEESGSPLMYWLEETTLPLSVNMPSDEICEQKFKEFDGNNALYLKWLRSKITQSKQVEKKEGEEGFRNGFRNSDGTLTQD